MTPNEETRQHMLSNDQSVALTLAGARDLAKLCDETTRSCRSALFPVAFVVFMCGAALAFAAAGAIARHDPLAAAAISLAQTMCLAAELAALAVVWRRVRALQRTKRFPRERMLDVARVMLPVTHPIRANLEQEFKEHRQKLRRYRPILFGLF